jgi:NRAMP (natural resistance-associated macrophage protein)-like metal ion transporter
MNMNTIDTTTQTPATPHKKTYLEKLGPGLITGASDDDPSGITTYSQAGAQYGLQMLWLSLWTFPLMAYVQEMCARIALVTGEGLAANIKKQLPRKVLYISTLLLCFANTLNIGADLGAMANVTTLVLPRVSFILLVVLFGIGSLLLQVYIPYQKYSSYLKWLVVALFSYIATGLLIHMDWSALLYYTIIPHITFTKEHILLVAGVLGTTISPYLFFWQTSQEVEEEIKDGKATLASRRGTNTEEIHDMRVDVWTGMFLSNLVMFFIIAVCGYTLFAHGVTNIQTARDAAHALVPFAGRYAELLFVIGIIGTGMLAIPVLAGSTSYALSESFGWKEGLYRTWKEARAFYGVISLSIVTGILFTLFGVDPIKALIYSAIANAIIAPVILVSIVMISAQKSVMKEFVNTKTQTAVGVFVILLMTITACGAIYALI